MKALGSRIEAGFRLFALSFVLVSDPVQAEAIEVWRRHVVDLPNESYSGNPFKLQVDGKFIHEESGHTIKMPGYYKGSNSWAISFMPPRAGTWHYTTQSHDPDLNGVTGQIEAIPSDLPGMLGPDPNHQRKWKFSDGPSVLPIGLLFNVFLEEATIKEFEQAADFLKVDVGGQLFNFRLTNRVFNGNWTEERFDLALWDRLESRMESLTDRGLGVSVMLYTDDAGKPPWREQSGTEELLIRYMVARLAAFPTVWFNTGIDIQEYRSQKWVNWFGAMVRSLDPYDHPISSRTGGGSGRLTMTRRTFESLSNTTAVMHELIAQFNESKFPLSMDDNWGEELEKRGNFQPADIRRALWKCLVAGGIAAHIRDGHTSGFIGVEDKDAWFHANNMRERLDSANWLRLINPFIQLELEPTFGSMIPTPGLAENMYAIADPARSIILFLIVSAYDRFESGTSASFYDKALNWWHKTVTGSEPGDEIRAKLIELKGRYKARWFDPRTGAISILGDLNGGRDYVVNPPSQDDWVLLLNRFN